MTAARYRTRPHLVDFAGEQAVVGLPRDELAAVNTLRRFTTRAASECGCGGSHYANVRRRAGGGFRMSLTCAPAGKPFVFRTRLGEARLVTP